MKFEDIKSQEDLDSLIAKAVEDGKKGLEAKVDELLTEKKTEAARRKEAEEAAKLKELEAAKSAGKIEEVEAALSEQWGEKYAKLEQQLQERDNEILASNKNAVLESLASSFTSPEAAKLMLNSMVETVRSETGIVTNFKGLDGQVVTTDSKKFGEYLASQDSLKPLIKGVNSSGGGATGGSGDTGGAGGSEDSVKGRLQARLAEKGLLN